MNKYVNIPVLQTISLLIIIVGCTISTPEPTPTATPIPTPTATPMPTPTATPIPTPTATPMPTTTLPRIITKKQQQAIAMQAAKSVVVICSSKETCGAGAIISPTLILTSSIIFDKSNTLTIRLFPLNDSENLQPSFIDGRIIDSNTKLNIAVIQTRKPLLHSSLAIATHNPVIGEDIFAIGHPKLSSGIGTWIITNGQTIKPCLRTNNSYFWSNLKHIQEGHYGGPIVNIEGKLIGILNPSASTPFYPETCTGKESATKIINLPMRPAPITKKNLNFHKKQLWNTTALARKHNSISTLNNQIQEWTQMYPTKTVLDTNKVIEKTIQYWPSKAYALHARKPIELNPKIFEENINDKETLQLLSIADKIRYSVVGVSNTCEEFKEGNPGSAGIIYSENLILTVTHILDNQPECIGIITAQGQKIKATIKHKSETPGILGITDIALLELETPVLLPPISIKNNESLAKNSPILTIGHPNAMRNYGGWIATVGKYDPFENEGISVVDIARKENAFLMRLHGSPGNSGGPILDINGNLIGINSGCNVDLAHIRTLSITPAPFKIYKEPPFLEYCTIQTAAPSWKILELLSTWLNKK